MFKLGNKDFENRCNSLRAVIGRSNTFTSIRKAMILVSVRDILH